ncbi:MAG: polysaccharide deacetylase family protein [Solirubrobacterales bacterium]|nr:polysaccharide deacetylase family protein [Solirubrobacterales bacterium]
MASPVTKALGAAAAGAAGFAWYHGQVPTSQFYGPTICRVPEAGKLIALTYDDGPNPEQTPGLMDVLERHGAKGTFLLIGSWAAREPELIQELVARGHAIGNHTFTHPTMPLRSSSQLREELLRCREAVDAAGVDFSRVDGEALMRPPYGRRRPATLRTLRDQGYVPLLWSITCFDWRRTVTADKIIRRAMRAEGGDIILLHDGSHLDPAHDRSASVTATDAVLSRLTEQGYRFVTVPELVAAGRTT